LANVKENRLVTGVQSKSWPFVFSNERRVQFVRKKDIREENVTLSVGNFF
jgi:hypothetical protein